MNFCTTFKNSIRQYPIYQPSAIMMARKLCVDKRCYQAL
jgi:hypothetical protein